MRRYYMVEKAKDVRIVGIVVGILGVVNYLNIINRFKVMIKKVGKKSYIFVVGKLNVLKLVNFMEIDVFVLVACLENSFIDSLEFYKLVVIFFEMELVCNSNFEWDGSYVINFIEFLLGNIYIIQNFFMSLKLFWGFQIISKMFYFIFNLYIS